MRHLEFAKNLVSTWKKAESAKTKKTKDKYWQECLSMCEKEQEYLFKNYAESTVIKVHTAKYRKAIAIEAGMFDDSIKGGYRYSVYPMMFWKIDSQLKNEIDERTKINIGKKKKDAIRIPVECREKLLELANDLLNSETTSAQSRFKKALAISLLTGRRFYVEVCRQGYFFPLEKTVDFNRTLGFIGQAKGNKDKAEQVYELPTYAENIELLIENTELIQTFIKNKSWYSDNISAQDFQSKIKSQCELALSCFNRICMEYGFSISIKDLRAIYMAFAYYDYRVLSGKMPDIDTYIGSLAGHEVITENGMYYKVGTTEHYKSFIDARWDE
jgi:hypothetical protein